MAIRSTSMTTYLNEIAPTLGSRQIAVLELFEGTKDADYTNNEMKSILKWEINCVTPRVYELRKYGILVESRVRRCRVSGRMVTAWRVKDTPAITKKAIVESTKFYQLPSQSNSSRAHVLKDNGRTLACSCKGYYYRSTCSHSEHIKKKVTDPRESMTPLFK